MGKARSFRLTKENEIRLDELVKRMNLDNPNKVFNQIIENYHYYEKDREALIHLRALFKIMEETK